MLKFLKCKKEVVPMQWTKNLPTETGSYLCASKYSDGSYDYIQRNIYENNGKLFYISFNEMIPISKLKGNYTHFMKIEEPDE